MNDISSEIRLSADIMLGAALDIATELLECGAEIRRTEDTVERICKAYGAERVDVFVITSLLIVTVKMPDGYHKTQTRRIYGTQNNFRRIEELNALSRDICRNVPDPDELEKMVKRCREDRKNYYVSRYIGALILASAFTVFFGGTWLDALASAAVALFMVTLMIFKMRGMNDIAHTVICSLVGGLLCIAALAAGFGQNADKMMIGTIMLLVPGMDVGNSLRDLLCGDIASGSMRLIKVILTAIAIAVGYSIAIIIGGGLNVL